MCSITSLYVILRLLTVKNDFNGYTLISINYSYIYWVILYIFLVAMSKKIKLHLSWRINLVYFKYR